MYARFPASLFVMLAASCILSACQFRGDGQRTDAPAPFGSMAQITSIAPDTTQVLRAGQPVKLKVDVGYVLTTDSGTVTLIVLAADHSAVAHAFERVTKRSGTATLEAAFTVPDTSVIRVFAPLILGDQRSNAVVDGREFRVIRD